MGVIEIASGSSCWRGLDYYESNKIKSLKKINDNEYKSIVSGTKDYNVYLNIEHPKKSTCNCPLANGKRIICKHIVATYFKAIPNIEEMIHVFDYGPEWIYNNTFISSSCSNKKRRTIKTI